MMDRNQAAERCGIPPNILAECERLGLIIVEEDGLYREWHTVRLGLIAKGLEIGFSLNEIKILIERRYDR